MNISIDDLKIATRGRWNIIYERLGINVGTGQHQACPHCGGKDRFRLSNENGHGEYYCNGCNPGDGISLVRKVFSLSFPDTLKKIADAIGYIPLDENKPFIPKEDPSVRLNKLWKSSKLLNTASPVLMYLKKRGIKINCHDIRYCESCWEPDTQAEYPAMIAMVRDYQGNPISLHRTYITKDGDKATIKKPKKLMPGKKQISGCAVQLNPAGKELGIAEGIETALAVTQIYGVPCWAVISTSGMKSFVPPVGVETLTIFADQDSNYAGHAAAYTAAHRLVSKVTTLNIQFPVIGNDFNDDLLAVEEI